ncbi:hypothetical protein [Streptacidiphilus sp. EB129]|uniref:hypothetical protein n=1 Tax=Streptacidiphilus sp. EB129 TaxID=3156262 RepID=UPI003516B028
MTHSATLHLHGVLVVFERVPLLSWDYTAPVHWTPSGQWPSPRQRRELQEHLDQGAPLLVVVGEPAGPSASAAPLDWLPQALRARGLGFLQATGVRILETPAALRPPLLLDDVAGGQVRFGRWTGTDAGAAASLGAVVRTLFGAAAMGAYVASAGFLETDIDPFCWSVARPETD